VARTDCIYDHFENATGYEEIALQARNCELYLATLAVAVAMSDRKFETEEGDEIREFFKGRIDDSDHQLKKDVSKRLKSTLKAIREGGKSASQFVESACSSLNAEGSTVCRQSAYEICARITACDNEVDQREHRALTFIAKSLNLDGDFVREVNDRFLKISMFKNATDEQLVGMPSGLTVQEKIAFINREYKKWRSRVTHSDPKVVSEANQRLDRLTKLRNKINKR
jgi:tellurite resistance protein